VADTGNHRIQVFDRSGRSLRSWGTRGRADGQFNRPQGIAWQGGRVYVADEGNSRIQVFDEQGRFQMAIQGGPDMPFSRPASVAAAADGTIYVGDADSNRLFAFAADGRFLKTWGDWGIYPGLFDEPSQLIWFRDRLLVCDRRNHRVQAFDSKGELTDIWGTHERTPHEGAGKLHYPNAVAVAPSGKFALVVEAIEDRMQIFEPQQGEAPLYDPTINTGKGRTHFGPYPATDGNLLAIVEPENHFVYLYDTKALDIPIQINLFGERGTDYGLLVRPSGVSIDLAARTVIVTDLVTRRLQEYRMDYDPAGELRFIPEMTHFVGSIDFKHLDDAIPGNRWPLQVDVIRRDSRDRRYLLDSYNAAVYVFGPEWNFLQTLGERDDLDWPTDLACDPAGDSVYVVAAGTGRIKIFDRKGRLRKTFGGRGQAPGSFVDPFGIAVDAAGFVYVSDRGAGTISKFTGRGRFVTRWGKHGDRMSELWKPAGLALDGSGRLIVIDLGNHRSQIFTTSGKWLVTFGAGRAYTWKNPPMERKD